VTDTHVTVADSGGWQRITHAEEVWATVVTFEIRDPQLRDDVEELFRDGAAFLHEVDRWFSTYRADSHITALRNGLMERDQMPAIVKAVLTNCEIVRDLTEGVFDPWALPDGVDPSGYVKGWAADVVADLFVSRGYPNCTINAAGDITCRGYQAPDRPWVIGIRHPDYSHQIVQTVEVFNQACATSGEYERGAHILNPQTGTATVQLRSATVVGPDGGMADALATALVIRGRDGVAWFAAMPEWSGYLIEGDRALTFGPAFA
jgi:thiamine biosynthesis lipoprotein